MQGGPHNHTIGALAVALLEVLQPEFKEYSKQILSNAKSLANGLMKRGHKLVTNGTDNHIVLWNLRDHGLTGSKIELISNYTNIAVNK